MSLIKSEDAIRIVADIDTQQAGWRTNAIESLKALTPWEPEIIMCKNCKWHGSIVCFNPKGCVETVPDGFCNFGEKG